MIFALLICLWNLFSYCSFWPSYNVLNTGAQQHSISKSSGQTIINTKVKKKKSHAEVHLLPTNPVSEMVKIYLTWTQLEFDSHIFQGRNGSKAIFKQSKANIEEMKTYFYVFEYSNMACREVIDTWLQNEKNKLEK